MGTKVALIKELIAKRDELETDLHNLQVEHAQLGQEYTCHDDKLTELYAENALLKERLTSINLLVYASNTMLGSEKYFTIRELCTKHLKQI